MSGGFQSAVTARVENPRTEPTAEECPKGVGDFRQPPVGKVSGCDQSAPMALAPGQRREVNARLAEILCDQVEFGLIYRHMLSRPGKRVRAALTIASAGLSGENVSGPVRVIDIACAMEMLHEASLIHDDICDGSVLRRSAASVPAAFGIRTAGRAGFHLAGVALEVLAQVISDGAEVFARLGDVTGVTYLNQLSQLSFGQLIETLPPAGDASTLRRHYTAVVAAKTGTLFRLACAYGGTAGAVDDYGLLALMRYANELAFAFQVMDDIRDVQGDKLGKHACGDLDRRVPTWPVIEWLTRHPAAEQMWLSPDTPSHRIRADLIASGGISAAHAIAIRASAAAQRALTRFVDSPSRQYLDALAAEVVSL